MRAGLAVGELRYRLDVADDPYRGQLRVPPDPYLVAWEDLWRRRAAMLGIACGCVPVSLLATTLVGGPAVFLVLPAMGAAAFASLRWSTFECPRCGQYFAGRKRSARRVCAHCGIAEGTPRSACTESIVTPLPDAPPV